MPPKILKRNAVEQEKVDQQTQGLVLYQFFACPFCIKTRRAIRRLALNIQTREIQGEYRAELLAEGGKIKAPCLKIVEGEEVRWLYESDDIIAYLDRRFGSA